MQIKIGSILYHPCSIDIMEFKITGILCYEDHTTFKAKATHNIGACGNVEVLLYQDRKGVFRFISLDDDYEYGSGLGDFVEGVYYLDKKEARLAYYDQQLTLTLSSMEEKRRLYECAKDKYEKVQNIIKTIKEEVKEEKEK